MASLFIALRMPLLMFRIRKPTKPGRKHVHDKDSDDEDCATPPRLVNYEELPDWYRVQECPFVTSKYRPESNSYNACIQSLAYVHNETMNIYTHLVPALVLACGLPLLQLNISRIYQHAPWMDRFMLTLTPMVALGTLTLSSTYHTLCNHSPLVSASCLLMDFTGILFLILASFVTAIYVGFYNHPFEQRLYWTMIALLITASCLLVLHPRLQHPKYRPHRTAAFVSTVLSGLGPAFHGMYVHGMYRGWHECGVKWWFAEGFWYALGVVFFVSRYPERLVYGKDGKGPWKGKFDVWGSSHSLFHTCVVLGATCHCWGVWEAWKFAV